MRSRIIFAVLAAGILWLPSISCKSSATETGPEDAGQSQSQPAASQSSEDEIMLRGITGSGRRTPTHRNPALITETTYR